MVLWDSYCCLCFTRWDKLSYKKGEVTFHRTYSKKQAKPALKPRLSDSYMTMGSKSRLGEARGYSMFPLFEPGLVKSLLLQIRTGPWFWGWGHRTSGKHLTYYYRIIIKDTTHAQPNRRDAQSEVSCGKRYRDSMPSSGIPSSQHLHVLTNPEVLRTYLLGSFIEVSLCRHDWWNHWPLVMELILQPPFLSW